MFLTTMRPPRVVIVVAFLLTVVLLTFVSLRSSLSSQTTELPSVSSKTGIFEFFSFRSPFSLFPPNALITLTHDNTTAFLARPAAFGPSLPFEGLRGQVWIGSDFGEATSGGELGCSDVPGWSNSFVKSDIDPSNKQISADNSLGSTLKLKTLRNGEREDEIFNIPSILPKSSAKSPLPAADDSTDDHLHHPLLESKIVKLKEGSSVNKKESHADIQSLKEEAEIAGKVVLLSRGGCGFLEKVKWSQRRGAVALIVGDNKMGGPLIQMFARGDTSSITIPSVFTSHTTAHLLCSLATSSTSIENIITGDENQTSHKKNDSKKRRMKVESHSTSESSKQFLKSNGPKLFETNKVSSLGTHTQSLAKEKFGWFWSIFTSSNNLNSNFESSRPPSSGQLDWVLVDDWKDEKEISSKSVPENFVKHIDSRKSGKLERKILKDSASKDQVDDDFMIGVQDWRDPDLVETNRPKDIKSSLGETSSSKAVGQEKTSKIVGSQSKQKYTAGLLPEISELIPPLKGGSITPSSGEYTIKGHEGKTEEITKKATKERQIDQSKSSSTNSYGNHREDTEFFLSVNNSSNNQDKKYARHKDHDGLWVTLRPSNGASPFLDTLLVLIVSPLITLTIVYALLLIRSRYRRQRWRAPKSVVERLPVRTYQTIVSPGSYTPRPPNLSSFSASTPLLQSTSKCCPGSQIASSIPESSDLIQKSNRVQSLDRGTREPDLEKPTGESCAWKKQTRTQVECVVCLEEYVDGVSRIMGLPCGHEFHVDCITPWLTTRRRTCPICKGDVVRSLARASRYENFLDDSEGDYLGQIDQTATRMTTAGVQINSGTRDDPELGTSLESHHGPERTRTGSWRSLLAGNFGTMSWNMRLTREDRDR